MIGASKGSSTIATERTPGEGAPGLEGARSQKPAPPSPVSAGGLCCSSVLRTPPGCVVRRALIVTCKCSLSGRPSVRLVLFIVSFVGTFFS